jgi:hypothetical protein
MHPTGMRPKRRGNKRLAVIAFAIVVTATLATGCGSPGASPRERSMSSASGPHINPRAGVVVGGAPGSTVTGRYVRRAGPGSPPSGLGRQSLGLFRSAAVVHATAVALTTTAPDGHFRFVDVPAGVWYLSPVRSAIGAVEGRWVEVSARTGAAADLTARPERAPRD